MHVGGEVDIRGAYCSAAVAVLTNIMDVELFDKTAEWIVSCQTYEGGFASCRDSEAHGGYSYCGVAALVLLGRQQLCDTKSLLVNTERQHFFCHLLPVSLPLSEMASFQADEIRRRLPRQDE